MADVTKKVIVDITLNDVEAKRQALAKVNSEIIKLKIEQDNLKDSIKLTGIATKEQTAQLQLLDSQLRVLNQDQKAAQKDFDNATRAVKSQMGSIEQMRATVAILSKEYYAMGEAERVTSTRGKELAAQIEALNTKINETKLGVNDSTSNIGKYEQATVSLRTEMRQLTQILAQMELQGKSNSKEYREMVVRLGQVKDAVGDVQARSKFFADDARYITGVTQAVQGLVGAFSIYQGVVALVDKEDKELQETMKRIQSLMVIMMGLQQVANTLNKDSAARVMFSVAAEKARAIQLAVTTRAQAANNVAQAKGTIAAYTQAGAWKVLNTVMKSNWFLAIAAAIIAVTVLMVKLSQRSAEYAQKLQEASFHSERFNEWQKEIVENTTKANEKYIDEKVTLDSLFKALQSTNTKQADRVKLIKEINDKYGSYLPNMLTEKSTAEDIAAAYKSIAEGMKLKLQQEIATENAKASLKAAARAGEDIRSLQNQIKWLREAKQAWDIANEAFKTEGEAEGRLLMARLPTEHAFATKRLKELGFGYAETEKAVAILQTQLQTLNQEQDAYTSSANNSAEAAAKLVAGVLDLDDKGGKATKTQAEHRKEIKATGTDYLDLMDKVKQVTGQLFNDRMQADLAALDAEILALRNTLTDGYLKGIISKEDYEAALTKLGEKGEKERADIRKKYGMEAIEKEFERATIMADEDRMKALQAEEKFIKDKLAIAERGSNEELKLQAELHKNLTEQQLEQISIDTQLAWDNEREVYLIKRDAIQAQIELEAEGSKRRAELEQELTELKKKEAQKQVDITRDAISAAVDILSMYYDYQNNKDQQALEEYENRQDERKQDLKNRLDQGVLSQSDYDRQIRKIEADAIRERKRVERDAAKRARDIAALQTIINTASGIAAALVGDPYSVGARIAIAAGVGAAQLALIYAQPLPSAAKGRYINGPSHAAGGEIIEAEGGEAIVNKVGTNRYLPFLDAIQRMSGGTPFINDGGYAAMTAAQRMHGGGTAQVVEAIKNMKIYTAIEDINRGQSRVNVTQNRATY